MRNADICRLFVGLTLCLAFAGCVTVESLDMIARQHPFKPRIEMSRNDRTISALPREKLIGRWKGAWVNAEAVWCGDGSYKFFPPTSFTTTYDFKADGSVTWVTEANGKPSAPVRTTWTYVNGDLTFNNLKRPHYTVFWFGENEMVIADRSADTANAFFLRHYKETYGAEYSHDVRYVRDRFLNVNIVAHHISPAKGERREQVINPRRFFRIKEESSGESVTVRRVDNEKDSSAASQKATELSYNIISCERESGSDFAYRFVLELTGSDKSLRTFRSVQKEFRQAVKEDYVESFPGVNKDSLFVEFPEYKLNNGKIEGRAVVLTISVTSLSYDPNTRQGRLAVKVSANQYEEARKWIRKNIETLARDKNIALVTGEIPPAAKFYLGREELKDGNILEIEFKTE